MQTSAKKEAKHHHRTQTEISFAFVQTIPVMLGYLCLGIAFGLMLQDAGYHFLWAFVCSLCIYAGSPLFGTCASTGYYGNSGCILHEKYAILVVYCMRNMQLFGGNHGLPEILASLVVILLHLWKRNTLLSIGAGTLCYMFFVQIVFKM